VETVHEKLAVVTRFSRWLATVKAVSGEASVMTSGPLPSSSSAQEALLWWDDGESLGGNGG
jgi:hypothetical protein